MTAISPGNAAFITQRQDLMSKTNDPALKKHFQAEIDLVKSWEPNDIDQGKPIDGAAPKNSLVVDGTDFKITSNFNAQSQNHPRLANGNSAPLTGGTTLGPGFPPKLEPYRQMIEDASAKTGVPAELLAAQIWDESRGDPTAGTVNGGNGMSDSGLMQINTGTFGELQKNHPELAGKNKDDPATNILAGAFLMKDMKEKMTEKYGKSDWGTALRAYNSGENGVDPNNLNALPAGTGTASYCDKIALYQQIIQQGGVLPA